MNQNTWMDRKKISGWSISTLLSPKMAIVLFEELDHRYDI